MPWEKRRTAAWDAGAFREALAHKGMTVPALRRALEGYSGRYRFELPSVTWFRQNLVRDHGKGLIHNPRLFEAVCEILEVRQMELLRRL